MYTKRQIVFINRNDFIKKQYMIVNFIKKLKTFQEKNIQESILLPDVSGVHNASYICCKKNGIPWQFITFNRKLRLIYVPNLVCIKERVPHDYSYMGKK